MKFEFEKIIKECSQQLIPFNERTWFETYVNANKKRFEHDLKLISSYTDKKAVIGDFGAAPFIIPLALQKMGHQVDAYDIAPERFKGIMDLGINIKKIDLDNWEKVENREYYDVIIFTEILEHLRGNLIQTLTNLLISLKPKGKIILSTPNLRSLMGIYKFLFRGISYSVSSDLFFEWNKLNTIGHVGHVREYTKHELAHFFQKIGFKILKSNTRPVKFDNRLKNRLFYHGERLFPGLGSNVLFILEKPAK